MQNEKEFVRHTAAIEHLYENLDKLIQEGTLNGRKIYMFGSSKVAGMIIYYLQSKGIKVEGIIDNNSKCVGNKMLGLEISSPTLLADTWDDKTLVLIVSKYQDAMIQQLEEMNYIYGKHIVKIIDFLEEMDNYSFVDRTDYIPLSDEEIKESQLNILRCVKRICEKHGLRYYLAYGTLLGAVRHKGYIPWDDDIDVYIPISNLDRFIEAVNEEKDFGIISTAAGMDYYDMISLMYDRSNICDLNHFPMQISAGITIDVFPLFGLPSDKMELMDYFEELKATSTDMLNKMYDKHACMQAAKDFFELMKKYDIHTASYVGNILSVYQTKEVFSTDWFADGTMLEFENETFCAPADYDSYLHAVYGDYMQLPPEEKRKGHHFYHAYKRLAESRGRK